VDLYRVAAVALVVAGHWLDASMAFHGGHFVRENPLVELPWTQRLTWSFNRFRSCFWWRDTQARHRGRDEPMLLLVTGAASGFGPPSGRQRGMLS
jgi:hypothetical protein